MRVFLETAVDAILVIDSRGVIESFNPAAERMFGHRELDVVGHNVSMLMPEPHAEGHDGYIEHFLQTGDARIIGVGREVEALRKDGTLFPAHLSVAELELDGEVRFTGILRDLSVEKEARAREAEAAHILETSLNEIFIFDAETLRFLQVNQGARANLGYTHDELLELTPVDIKPDYELADFQTLVEPLRRGESGSLSFRTRHERKDGTVYPVEVHLQLSGFAGREVFVAIILDTTEREALEQELLHAQKLEAVGQLAGALAHDFNNLLMSVLSGCKMIAREVGDRPEALEILAQMQREARSGAGITRQLLDFSRKKKYEARACSLGAVVTGMREMLGKLLGEDVELRITARDEGHAILADPGKLEQIVMNLVVNARDAMPAGGLIDVEVAPVQVDARSQELERGPHVRLTVTDSGTGMDEATRKRIFDPFFTTKPKGKGTGLGLATVFGVTREFGGHIEVESAPGSGTSFRLTFPQTEVAPGGELEGSRAAEQSGSETILVVEDVALVRAGIRSLLQEMGYVVFDAPHPAAAIELAAERPDIDLLITDIVMPGMDGTELAARLAQTHPRTRVLFMSAYSDAALVEQGRLQSGTRVLEKPFEEETLAARVREVLSKAP